MNMASVEIEIGPIAVDIFSTINTVSVEVLSQSATAVLIVGSTSAQIELAKSTITEIEVSPLGAQGPIGPQGPTGSSGGAANEIEFTVQNAGDQVITLPIAPTAFPVLFVQGIRQSSTAYTIVGRILTIPASLVWLGATVIFDF